MANKNSDILQLLILFCVLAILCLEVFGTFRRESLMQGNEDIELKAAEEWAAQKFKDEFERRWNEKAKK